MRTIARKWSAASFVILALSACASAPRGEPGVLPPETTLLVENRSITELRVYALSSGQRTRLGSVGGNATARLPIPDRLVGAGQRLGFVVDQVGGGRASTNYEIYVTPGREVRLLIPANLR